MITELIAYPLAIVIGIVAGWILRSPGSKLMKQKLSNLQNQLQDCRAKNDQREKDLLSSERRVNELLSSQSDQAAENARRIVLQNEITRLTARLEENDALLQSGQPVVHALKLKLIEANNTILRYKSKLEKGG